MEAPVPGYCVVVHDFLSRDECKRLIALSEASGFGRADSDYPPSYRNNDRLVLDDLDLAQSLFARLRSHAPAQLSDGTESWCLEDLNPRLRFCRYAAEQAFGIHQDGVHHRSPDCRSMLTFMIYLTDASEFEGGDTLFFSAGPGAAQPTVTARVRPRAGSLIMFDHALWHAGDVVTRGTKHVLRSDLMYRRAAPRGQEPERAWTGHQGYVWTLADLGQGRIASGGRDASIRLWNRQGQALGDLRGHSRSVLGLAALTGSGAHAEARASTERLVSVSRDRSLRLWDIPSQRCLRSVVAHPAAVLCVAALPAGRIATGGADGSVRIWNAELDCLASLTGHRGWVWALAVIGAGHLASASEDGSIRVLDLDTLDCTGKVEGLAPLRSLAASAHGDSLFSGDVAGTVQEWGELRRQPRALRSFTAHHAAVRRVRLLDDHTLASAGEDNAVRFWHREDLRLLGAAQHSNFATDVLALDACDALDNGRALSSSYAGDIVPQRVQR
jgi:predicted 2-oxoglutarate/Fe(II)-dependent dioxygenase YbiX